MTVKKLREILELFPDDKEVVIEIEPNYYNLRSVFEDKEANVIVVGRGAKDPNDPNISPFFSFDSDLDDFKDLLIKKLGWKKGPKDNQNSPDFIDPEGN